MYKHLVICDSCKAKSNLSYNGEHYLPPKGWMELYDDNLARHTEVHLCPKCHPKAKKKK